MQYVQKVKFLVSDNPLSVSLSLRCSTWGWSVTPWVACPPLRPWTPRQTPAENPRPWATTTYSTASDGTPTRSRTTWRSSNAGSYLRTDAEKLTRGVTFTSYRVNQGNGTSSSSSIDMMIRPRQETGTVALSSSWQVQQWLPPATMS